MSPHYLIAIFALLFPLLTAAVDNSRVDSTPVGEWIPLKNISDPLVIKIANFAVDANTHQNQKHLTFQNVINGYYQVESGIQYKLIIRVNDDNVHFPTTDYQAIVLLKGSVPEKLISFEQITN